MVGAVHDVLRGLVRSIGTERDRLKRAVEQERLQHLTPNNSLQRNLAEVHHKPCDVISVFAGIEAKRRSEEPTGADPH